MHTLLHPLFRRILAAGALLLLAGCAAPVHSVPQEQQADIFIPATRAVTSEPTLTATIPAPVATPTPDCENGLKFLTDVTIPDGTQVEPGAEVDKRWEVENTGTCSWDERYALLNVEGPELGIAKKQSLYPAVGGARATLQVRFQAPAEPGTYRSVWQAAGPGNEPFGDRFYVEFEVVE